jgi:hypothetical protein
MTKTKTPEPALFEGRQHIAPAPDRQVRKPDGSLLPPEGETVNVDEDLSYWLRRLNDEDIVAGPAKDGEAE